MRSGHATMGILISALVVVSCGSAAPSSSVPATATPAGSSVPATPSAPPPLPTGPFALLLTNASRQGSTYDVLLVDTSARVVARVTAKLPLLKAHQTIALPVASAGRTAAYYLDGDTDIHALRADGSTPLVKSVAEGRAAALAFAVSPDSQRIGISAISQQADDSKTTGHGYIEDLGGTGGHAEIFKNTAAEAYRWPIAWYQTRIIDAIGSGSCGQTAYGNANISCAASLHVIDAGNQNRVATICEAPAAPTGQSYTWYLSGLPTPAGIACSHNEQLQRPDGSYSQTCEVTAVDLGGKTRTFLSQDCSGPTAGPPGNCYLAPDGARMACQATNNQALVFLASNGSSTSLGHKYTLLGWIDTAHLMVEIDATTLAVLDVSSGAAVNLTMTNADQVSMLGVVGG